MDILEKSYAWCVQKTREEAKNFYYAIFLLPKSRRAAMCAVYAFFRECDDIADAQNVSNRRQSLLNWKEVLKSNAPSDYPGLLALRDAVDRYKINPQHFLDLIDGMIMDLDNVEYKTFDDLYNYCYRAASTVGLVCMSIFGYEDRPEVLKMAEKLGIAFQLTNIIRDITPDAAEGRVYIPEEFLHVFQLTKEQILNRSYDLSHMSRLLDYLTQTAEEYYRLAEFLPYFVSPQSRTCLRAMINIYHGILEHLRSMGVRSLREKARLSLLEKLWAMLSAYLFTAFENLKELLCKR
ncbi:phytoene/squalene synthase family protein [bacterium]|nr:phytoene/squalene synthase family protein [bacterium]